MSKVRFSLKFAVVLVVIVFVAAGFSHPATAQSSPKIAILGPFTGDVASIGTEQLNFAKLAVADFNKASGMSVELVEVDTQLDAAKAVTGAQSVVSNADIVGVVGPAG